MSKFPVLFGSYCFEYLVLNSHHILITATHLVRTWMRCVNQISKHFAVYRASAEELLLTSHQQVIAQGSS